MSKVVVVLDLDQTLISSEPTTKLRKRELKRLDQFDHFNMGNVYVVFARPYLQEFFDFLSDSKQDFEVAVWTAATGPYASDIIDKLYHDGERRNPLFIFHEEHTNLSERTPRLGGHKDLRLLWDVFQIPGVTRENTVIIDDNKLVTHPQPFNSIPAPPFYVTDEGSEGDDFLSHLPLILLNIKNKLRSLPDQ